MDTDSAATSGTMTITKHLYNEARPYNSTVAFEGGIDSAWRAYIDSSGVPTTSILSDAEREEGNGDSLVWCGGLWIQKVANVGGIGAAAVKHHDEIALDIQNRFSDQAEASSIMSQFRRATAEKGNLVDAVKESVLKKYGLAEEVGEVDYTALDYHCRCHLTDYVGRIVATLSRADIVGLLDEEQTKAAGGVEVKCEMCGREHVIRSGDIREKME